MRPGPNVTTARYEFSDSQNRVFIDLATAMRMVGLATCALGVTLVLAGTWLWILTPGSSGPLSSVFLRGWPFALPGCLFLSIGLPTLHASHNFRAIAETSGDDVALLVDALDALTHSFRTQLWFSALGAVLVAMLAFSVLYS